MAELSIVVTAYNVAPYLRQCLESIAAQTLTDIEVIVVDDGSDDASPQIIQEFAGRDERFVAVLLPDNSPGGVATAANAGLDRATAPYVGFMDGDDYCEPTMFATLLGAARGADADLAMCQYEEVDPDGQHRPPADAGRWATLEGTVFTLDTPARKRFLRFIAVPWRKVYRRDLLERHGIRFPVGDRFYEDNPFHWFVLLTARSIAVVPEVLCYHRVGRSGQTMAAADERLFKIFDHHATIRAWLLERGLLDEFATSLLGWVISQAEWISERTPPELQRTLFDVLVPIVALYPPATVTAALHEGQKGQRAHRLTDTLTRADLAAFRRVLSGDPPEERSTARLLAAKTAHHLRESGPRRTAQIVARYTGQRLRSTGIGDLVRRNSRASVRTSDVMFALVVLERRLDQIDASIAEIRRAVHELASRDGDRAAGGGS